MYFSCLKLWIGVKYKQQTKKKSTFIHKHYIQAHCSLSHVFKTHKLWFSHSCHHVCEVKHAQQLGDLGISVYFLWMLCGFLTLIASMLFLWHRAFVLWKRLVTYWQNVLGNVACRGHQRGFVPPWGEDGFAVGRTPGFEPLSLEVRGLAVVGTACKGGRSWWKLKDKVPWRWW